MPRKRRISSSTSIDDDDFCKDEFEGKAPRNAANARERARMRVLSKAFCRLKTTLPWVPADTKLSKLDTLRLAATYIAHLRAVLREDNSADHSETTRSVSLTLSWPFSIQNGTSSHQYNNSCSVSSTSDLSHSNQYYRSQHEVECYHNVNHQNNLSNYRNDSQQIFY